MAQTHQICAINSKLSLNKAGRCHQELFSLNNSQLQLELGLYKLYSAAGMYSAAHRSACAALAVHTLYCTVRQ